MHTPISNIRMDRVTWHFAEHHSKHKVQLGGYLPYSPAPEIYINPVKCEMSIDIMSETIAHEVIHAILHRDESKEVSKQFDNIAYSTKSRIAFDQYLHPHLPFIQLKFI